MHALVVLAVIVAAAIAWMWIYTKSHPPEVSERGAIRLRRGLWLGTMSSVGILALYVVMLQFPAVSPLLFWPLTIVAVAGNVLNLIALVSCLREFSGQSLCAGFLVLLSQFLWSFYAIRALTIDF